MCGLVCDSLVYLVDDLTCGLESAELGVARADPVRHHATQCGRWAGPLSLPPGSRWPEQPGRRAARRSSSPPHLEPDFLRRTETVVRGILDSTIILFSPSSPALRFAGDEGLGFAAAALAASLAALARACIAASCSGGPKRRFAPNAFWTSAAWGATQELKGNPDKLSFGFERQRPQNDHSRRSKVSTPTLVSGGDQPHNIAAHPPGHDGGGRGRGIQQVAQHRCGAGNARWILSGLQRRSRHRTGPWPRPQ